MKITGLSAREILDSRGIPTIEATIELDARYQAKGAVPSGASTGTTEVLELRDGDPSRYFGKGTLSAVRSVVENIAPALINKEFNTQKELDEYLIQLDGTEQKGSLGGNSILAVSMAFCRASAMTMNMPLYEYFARIFWGEEFSTRKYKMPTPMILIMEGGKHGNWATDIQEYMIVPDQKKFTSYSECVRVGAEIFKATHDLLIQKGYAGTVGFEGAFAPIQIRSNHEAFDLILQGVTLAGYKPGTDITLAMDIAASEFFNKETGLYDLRREDKELTGPQWIDLQREWIGKYPISSIEDGFHEEDWDMWVRFTDEFGSELQIVGDDLLTTNVKRIRKAIELDAVNSVLIKLNQIGTVTETLDAIKLSTEVGYSAVISHRGGETNDDMIADLVVGTSADQTKFGGPDRGERLAKYNRMMEIEEELQQVKI